MSKSIEFNFSQNSKISNLIVFKSIYALLYLQLSFFLEGILTRIFFLEVMKDIVCYKLKKRFLK